MNDNIRRRGDWPTNITTHVEVSCQGIEDLPRIREICLERVDIGCWIWEGNEVKIEHLVALREQIWDGMAASFAASSGEDLGILLICVNSHSNKGVTYDPFPSNCWYCGVRHVVVLRLWRR